MKKHTLVLLLLVPVAAATGFLLRPGPPETPVFHDLRVNPIHDYVNLIEPEDPDIVALARQFSSFEEAYRFVRDQIAFAPFVPPGPVSETLKHRMGSCLGKAALLCSLYRAMGMPAEDLRIVMGLVVVSGGTADHVWIDLEFEGRCLQQDPSGMLGSFAFNQFPGTRYVQTYVMKETVCFNESGFAVVSQLNRFRDETAVD